MEKGNQKFTVEEMLKYLEDQVLVEKPGVTRTSVLKIANKDTWNRTLTLIIKERASKTKEIS
jgi:hypothetical protein